MPLVLVGDNWSRNAKTVGTSIHNVEDLSRSFRKEKSMQFMISKDT